ncbi:MAG: FG-GAP-like repeat-containing protein [Candidatus Hermodarchaeota archaeon]
MRLRSFYVIIFTALLASGLLSFSGGFGILRSPEFVVAAQFGSVPIFEEINVDDELGESDGVEIADVDHDGLNELVWLGSWFSVDAHHTMRYYDNESGMLTGYDILDVPIGWEMDTGDVDNDGQVEIAWGAYSSFENEVRAYDYVDDHWVECNITDISGPLEEVMVNHVAIGDVDNDGLNELAIGLNEHAYFNRSVWPEVDYTVRYYKNESEGWTEYLVGDSGYDVEVVEIGDVDNDGENELLVGLKWWSIFVYPDPPPVPYELRYYEYELGSWVEHNITDLPNDVGRRAVKIGDIDHDGLNEVVVGTVGGSEGINQLRYFKYDVGGWTEYIVTEIESYFHALEIGDLDNDGFNEIVAGIVINEMYELRYFKYGLGVWTEYNIADPNITVFSIAIGDLDNDGQNEVAMGLMSNPGFELRYYELTGFIEAPPVLPWLIIGVIIVVVSVTLVVSLTIYRRRKQ